MALLPESLHKWVPMIANWCMRSFAVSLAWTLQVIIVAFHSSLRGANLFVSGMLALLVKHNVIQKKILPPKESARMHTLVYVVAAVGFFYQAKNHFSVPFPLNLVLWPCSMIEFSLKLIVGTYGM